MSDIDRGADIVVASKSQTAEQIQKALADSGYADIRTETISPAAPPVEDPAPEAAAPAAPAEPIVADSEPDTPRHSDEQKIIRLEETLKLEREAREKQDREIAELRTKATIAAAQPAASIPEQGSTGPDPDEMPIPIPKPTRADFFDADDPDEAYIDARGEWRHQEKARLARVAEKQKARQVEEIKAQEEDRRRQAAADEQRAAVRKVEAAYQDSVKAARARHADWDAVLTKQHPDPVWNGAMGIAIRHLGGNAEILYWLGQHPEEASRICAATVVPANATNLEKERAISRAALELGKVEDRMRARPPASGPVRPPVRHTPVTPVGSRGGTVAKSLAEMSPEEIRQLPIAEYRRLRGA